MPFKIIRVGASYVVVTKGTNKVHGRFRSRAKARAQLRALYANVIEARRS